MSFFQSITTLNGLSKALLLPRGEKLQFIKKKQILKNLILVFFVDLFWKSAENPNKLQFFTFGQNQCFT